MGSPSLRLRFALMLLLLGAPLLAGCASPSGIRPLGLGPDEIPIDLERFMGDWYVVAHIPLSVEAQAHEAVESYALRDDGTIDVRFRFCEGSLDGPAEELRMRAWVFDPETNAEWRVRPFWPLRLRYQILELDPDYRLTVVGHPSGSYAWVMARSPGVAEETLAPIIERLNQRGYETDRLRRVPHASGACRTAAES